jgi:uncharacterized membrane protein YhaH (DUF805 family)
MILGKRADMSEAAPSGNIIQEYFINIFRYKYIQYQGRARRKEFWMFWLFNLICGQVLGLIPYVGSLYVLVALVPSICLHIRRLHDIGKSGWWLLLPLPFFICLILIRYLLTLSAYVRLGAYVPYIAFEGLIWSYFVSCIIIMVFACLDSQPGENRYGPNPKGSWSSIGGWL